VRKYWKGVWGWWGERLVEGRKGVIVNDIEEVVLFMLSERFKGEL
jgi:hypothetical protein